MKRLLFLVVLGLALGSPASAFPQAPKVEYLDALDLAQEELIDDLEELADWCRANKLLLEADLCYRQVLRFDAEHPRARAALRFTKRDGGWVQASSYRQPKNYSKDALEPFAAKRLEAMQPYKRAVLELNLAHAKIVPLERRERVLLELLELTPDDPDVRLALNEALVRGEWKLLETKNALECRSTLPELAQRCIETSALGKPVEPNGLEKQLGLAWSLVLQSDYVRVAGTGSPEEVENVMRVTQGAAEFFRTLLQNDTIPPVGFAVYLLSRSHEKGQFLDNHPGVKAQDRPFLESLDSAGIPRANQSVEWSSTEELRLDRSTRQTVGMLLANTYGITVDTGWAWEGFGIYLTYQLIGTRMTYYMRPDRYAVDPDMAKGLQQLFTRMFSPGADWLNEARIHFAERKPPKLAILMGRKVDTLSAEDLLWSYVLASYLIEGLPQKTPAFLGALGKGRQPPAEAMRNTLDMELPRLEQRVVRWLEETR